MKKILFINPKYEFSFFTVPPLGIIHLANLTPKDISFKIIDENIESIKYEKYDLVAISVTTAIANRAYIIADKFRKLGVNVILGGIHVSFMSNEAKNHADSIVIGEAEGLWKQICSDLIDNNIKKKYNSSKRIDISNLKPMNHNVINRKKYYYKNSIQFTRGCLHNCEFCSTRQFFGSKIRKRKISSAIEEIKHMVKTSSGLVKNFVSFNDDNIIADVKYAKELFRALIPLNIRWSAQSTINIAHNPELLELAYRSGCRMLFIGLESVDQNSLNEVNKKNKAKTYLQAIKKIKKFKILIYGLFILGFDSDKKSIFRRTLAFCNKCEIDFVSYNILRPFPGSKLFERLSRENRIISYNWDKYERAVSKPTNMSIKELEKGVNWLNNSFYSHLNIIKRSFKSLKYHPSVFALLIYVIQSYLNRFNAKKINKLSL